MAEFEALSIETARGGMAQGLRDACREMADALANPHVRARAVKAVQRYQALMIVGGEVCADHIKHEAAIAYQILDSVLAVDPKSERGERLRRLLAAAVDLLDRAQARVPEAPAPHPLDHPMYSRKDVFG